MAAACSSGEPYQNLHFLKSFFIRDEHGCKGNLDNIAPLNLAREDFILAAAGCTALSKDGPLDGGCKEEEGTGVDEEELLLGAEEDGRGSADAATDRAASLSSTEIRESAPAVNKNKAINNKNIPSSKISIRNTNNKNIK